MTDKHSWYKAVLQRDTLKKELDRLHYITDAIIKAAVKYDD